MSMREVLNLAPNPKKPEPEKSSPALGVLDVIIHRIVALEAAGLKTAKNVEAIARPVSSLARFAQSVKAKLLHFGSIIAQLDARITQVEARKVETVKGEQGRSIVDVCLESNGDLNFLMSDGELITAGNLLPLVKPPLAYDPNQPREPAGSPDGGQWTDGDGGGSGDAGKDGGAKIDPKVVEVSGDQWNKETALRLEKEYAENKEELEKLLQEGVGENVEATGEAQSWDDLSGDQQELAEADYIQSNFDQEQQFYYESWQTDGDHDFVREKIVEDDEWLSEKITDWVDENTEEGELKLTSEQLTNAAMLNPDGSLEWNDKYLATLSDYDPSPQFPGFEPPTTEELSYGVLPEGIRDELSDAMEDNFKDELQTRIENMPVGDVVDDDVVKESLSDSWSSMDDDEKLAYAKKALDLDESESNISTEVRIPSTFQPIDANKAGYADTKAVATYLSQHRTLELINERGIKTPMGAQVYLTSIQDVDSSVWESWKGSSSSQGGKALQLAAAQELGGRVQYTDQEVSSIITYANSHYSEIGGYEGLKAYTRAKWETSQFILEKAEMPVVTIYRGVIVPASTLSNMNVNKIESGYSTYDALPDFPLQRNGAQSATANKAIANGWNGVGVSGIPDPTRIVVRAEVPRTAVLSLPVYGQNVHSEQEIVVVGTAWKKWDVFKQRAPSTSDVPINMKRLRFILAMIRAAVKKGKLKGPGPGLRQNEKGEWEFGISEYEEDLKLPNWLNEYRDGTHKTVAPPKSKPLPKAELKANLQAYNPDQPRVPAGEPDGGQWTGDGGGGGSSDGGGASERKSYSELPYDDFVKQANDRLKQKFDGQITIDTSDAYGFKVADNLRDPILNEIERLGEEVPLSSKLILRTEPMLPYQAGLREEYGTAPLIMAFSGFRFKDSERISRELKESKEKYRGYHDDMTQIESIVRHEYGHAFEHDLNTYNWAQAGETNQAYQKFTDVAIGLMDAPDTAFVTRYAALNPTEHFAESFAALEFGDERAKAHPSVKAMAKLVREYKKKR